MKNRIILFIFLVNILFVINQKNVAARVHTSTGGNCEYMQKFNDRVSTGDEIKYQILSNLDYDSPCNLTLSKGVTHNFYISCRSIGLYGTIVNYSNLIINIQSDATFTISKLENYGTVTVKSGTLKITEEVFNNGGGSIIVEGGILDIENAQNIDNMDGASIIVSGGTLDDGSDTGSDSNAAYIINHGSFEVNGGTIDVNIINLNTFTMLGGTIETSGAETLVTNGSATNRDAEFTMTGGTIKNHYSGDSCTNSLGCVNIDNYATLKIENGTITNTAKNGYGVLNRSGASFTMSGGGIDVSTESDNFTGYAGVSNQGGTFTMSGGTITSDGNSVETGISFKNTGIFNLSGGTISGSMCVENTGIFNMSGGKIKDCDYLAVNNRNTGSGSDITPAEFTMSGGEITGTITISGYPMGSLSFAYILNEGKFEMKAGGTEEEPTSGTISCNDTSSGGVCIVNALEYEAPDPVFNMSAGTINFTGISGTDSSAVLNGQNSIDIANPSDAIFNLTGGTINTNVVGVDNQSSFTMSGGTVNNHDLWSTGIVNNSGAVISMSGGTISGDGSIGIDNDFGGTVNISGTALITGQGQGLHIVSTSGSGVTNITGGTITNNAIGILYDPGISGENYDKLTISGNPVISGNDSFNLWYPVLYDKGIPINVGTLTSGANIGIMLESSGVFTSGYSTNNSGVAPSSYFFVDPPANYLVVLKDGEAALVGDPVVTFKANGGTGVDRWQTVSYNTATALNANTFTNLGASFLKWNTAENGSGTDYADGASVTLTDDLTLYAQWDNNFQVSECTQIQNKLAALPSGTMTFTLSERVDSVCSLTINENQNVTLDLNGNKFGLETNATSEITNNGTFTLTNNGANANLFGLVTNTGTFTMNGGTINSSDSSDRAGVTNYGIFTMTGGTIGDHFGTAVLNLCNTTTKTQAVFTMTGGTINAEPKTGTIGFGIINEGKFIMAAGGTEAMPTSGTINCSTANASTYCVENTRNMVNFLIESDSYPDPTFTMSAGTITNNGNNCSNPLVRITEGTGMMTGGTIINTTGPGVENNASFTLSDGMIQSLTPAVYNKALDNITLPTLTMSGGNIICTGADPFNNNGSAVQNEGAFTMFSGTITSVDIITSLWGVYNENAFNMRGGTISQFALGVVNGDEYGSGEEFNLSGGTITENLAGVVSNSSVKISGNPVISGNEADGVKCNLWIIPSSNVELPITITGALSEGASIGISMANIGTFTSGYSTYNSGVDPATYFFSDEDGYRVVLKDGEATLMSAVNPIVTLDSWTYGDTANSPSVSGNTGNGAVTYTYYTDEGLTTLTTNSNSGAASDGGQPVNAGTWYIKASIAETDHYLGGTASTSFVISKANPVIISTPEAVDATYDGTEHVLAKGLEPFEFAEVDSLAAVNVDELLEAKAVAGVGTEETSDVSLRLTRIGESFPALSAGAELPATGFSSHVKTPLAVKPDGVSYKNLGLRIQIPALNVDSEVVGVPVLDGSYPIDWLGDQAGILSGSARPGEGYTFIAGHNTLNNTEYGPFALLFSLDINDTIMVTDASNGLKLFRVYANKLVDADGFDAIAQTAAREPGSLVLLTCENESVDGGYLNRRVVFAKPL